MDTNTKNLGAALAKIDEIEAKAKQMLALCATLRRSLKAEAGEEDSHLDMSVAAARKRPEWVVVDEGGAALSVRHERASVPTGMTILTHPLTWSAAQAHLDRDGLGRGWSRWSETKYAPLPQKS